MALEALVIALCLGDYKCDMASKAYYEQAPIIKQYAGHVSRQAAQKVGPVLAFAAPATVSLFVRHVARIKLTSHLTLDARPDTVNILWAMTF